MYIFLLLLLIPILPVFSPVVVVESLRFCFRTPATISADKLYRNDGISFEDNWQERVIERY